MRLLYVAVVVSVASMILIGSFMYSPAALKTAVTRPMTKIIGDTHGAGRNGSTLSDMIKKYKAEIWQLFQVKKASAGIGR